jgi:membrane-bound metal-dependent hydrolase YbcI (DUF457 family)
MKNLKDQMEFQTHALVGVIIYEVFNRLDLPESQFVLIVAVLALLSHVIVDFFTVFTYHPKQPLWNDPFWKISHLYALIISIIVGIWLIPTYWWVILCACAPDILDWLILRPILHHTPPVHKGIEWLEYAVWKDFNLYERRGAFITEIIIDLVLFIIFLGAF